LADDLKIQDDQVVSMDYILHVNGEKIDESQAGAPLEFIQGKGNIIPGLERALYGMGVGESKSVIVEPADGYGEVDKTLFAHVPKSQFPTNIPLETGVELQVHDKDGTTRIAYINSVEADSVRLDFNHPLAGKELHFDVTIAALRPATKIELTRRHVHES